MAKTIKIKNIDNDKSEKAALVFFEGDEYKQAVFLPKSVIEVDDDNVLTCSIDDILDAAMTKAQEESTFSKGDGNKMIELVEASWDVEGRASLGFDVVVFDKGMEVPDFNTRAFVARSKIEDGKAPFWLICSAVARAIVSKSSEKFANDGISEAIIDSPEDFEVSGITEDAIKGKDLTYQIKKAMDS